MKTIFSRIACACLALAMLVSGPLAFAGAPIPGIDIIVRKNPGGDLAVNTHTDGRGGFIATLTPGRYTVEIPAATLARVLDKVDPDPKHAPVKLTLTFSGARKVMVAPALVFVRTGTPRPVVFSLVIGDFDADGHPDSPVKLSGSLTFTR